MARGRSAQPESKHVVVINGKRHFVAAFFKTFRLKPFPLDLDTLDDDSDFLNHLGNSLAINGWNRDKPLLFSVPQDPDLPNAEELYGHIIDARHRSVGWQLRFEKGLSVPEPELKPVPVISMEHVLILRAHYELLNRSKDAKVAKRHAFKIIYERLENHPELKTEEKAVEFFTVYGLKDSQTIKQAFQKIQRKRMKQAEAQRPMRPSAKDLFTRHFGDTPATEHNPMTVEEDATSRRLLCPKCKQDLKCEACGAKYALLIYGDGRTQLKELVVANAKR